MKIKTFEKILKNSLIQSSFITLSLICVSLGIIDVNNAFQTEKQAMSKSLEQAQININNHIQLINDYLTLTHANPTIQSLARDIYADENFEIASIASINNTLFSTDLFKKTVNSMQLFLYSSSIQLPLINTNKQHYNAVFSTNNMDGEIWFHETLKAQGRTFWFIDNDSQSTPMLCGTRILYDCNSPSQMLGILKSNTSLSKLMNPLSYMSFDNYTNTNLKAGLNYYSIDSRSIISKVNAQYEDENFHRTNLIVRFPLLIDSWELIGTASKFDLYLATSKTLLSIVLISIFSLFFSLLFAIRNSKKISLPINSLCNNMQELKEIPIPVNPHCIEMKQLFSSYNQMLINSEKLYLEREESITKYKQAEITSLQAQINPHFIYNTLESINALIQMDAKIQATEMINRLGIFLRNSLNNGNNLITLKNEIEQVKSYFAIQQVRFTNSIKLNTNIEISLDKYRIIKLILQPLVENSIIHGFKDLDYLGIISLFVTENEQHLILMVADNGWGSDIETLNHILKQKTFYEDNNINFYCIQNIYQRLNNIYENNFSFYYEENSDGGVTAIIKIDKNLCI